MVKAIETEYAGCRFRSRLEARWAVFFDQLGYTWEYEPEGFELRSGRYLPDFWLPYQKKWVEIKGSLPSHHDFERFMQFAPYQWDDGARFSILIGDIPRPYPEPKVIPSIVYSELPINPQLSDEELEDSKRIARQVGLPDGSQPMGIAKPGNNGLIIFDDRVMDSCGCTGFPGFGYMPWVPAGDFLPALYAARSARFEFGEHGHR